MIAVAEQQTSDVRPSGDRGYRSALLERMILTGIGLFITVRFFTERFDVLPRFLNAVDLVFVPLLLVTFVGRVFLDRREARLIRGARLLALTALFVVVCIVSATVNVEVHWLGLALFVFGLLTPIMLLLVLINLNPSPRFIPRMIGLLNWLFLINLVVGLVDAYLGYAPDAGDFMLGTFGYNQNQFSFFMAYMLGLFIARWVDRGLTWFELLLFAVGTIEFVLGRFQTLWLVFPTAAVLSLLARGIFPRRGWQIASLAVLLLAASYLVSEMVHSFALGELVDQAQNEFDQLGKVELVRNVPEVWGSSVWASWIGVGPGTFNSRAFRSIADVPYAGGDAAAVSDVAAAVLAPFYHSTLADRYIIPYFARGKTRLTGSNTDGPFTSFVSIPVEAGLLGAGALFGIYALQLGGLLRALRGRGPQSPLALWAMIVMLMLLGIAVLDNYLEVTRYSILVWLAVGLWDVSARQRAAEHTSFAPERPSRNGLAH